MQSLDGVRVLDLSRMFPGALCTQLLAGMGADVLKVEAPGRGDGLRMLVQDDFAAAHEALNRGKRSLTLDLRSDAGPGVLRRLAAEVDVVVESHKPGALDRLGVGFDDLRADNPGLVWCSLTGFGPVGPYAEAPGHDLTFLGFSGVLSTLTADGEPVLPGSTLSVPLAAVMAAFGVAAAIAGRSRTGTGTRVDASMVDASMWSIGDLLAQAANAAATPWPAMASRDNYRCADGRWITCTATESRSWATLIEAIGAPELAGYGRDVDDATARARLTELFATRPAADWVADPGPAGGIGPVAEPDGIVADPDAPLVDVGGMRLLPGPLRLDGARPAPGSPAPALGAHTDEALAAAGFDADQIAALRSDGVV